MRGGIVGKIDVVQHPAEIARASQVLGHFEFGVRGDRLEKGGELAAAEARLLDALTSGDPASSHIGVFAGVVPRAGLGRHLEVGVNDVIDIAEQQTCPLLPLLLDEEKEFRLIPLCALTRG